jgi:hypothetical protein
MGYRGAIGLRQCLLSERHLATVADTSVGSGEISLVTRIRFISVNRILSTQAGRLGLITLRSWTRDNLPGRPLLHHTMPGIWMRHRSRSANTTCFRLIRKYAQRADQLHRYSFAQTATQVFRSRLRRLPAPEGSGRPIQFRSRAARGYRPQWGILTWTGEKGRLQSGATRSGHPKYWSRDGIWRVLYEQPFVLFALGR